MSASLNDKRTICLLGATGSIGTSTLNVIRQHPDKFDVISLAAGTRWEPLIPLIKEFKVRKACLWSSEAAAALAKHTSIPVYSGKEGLLRLAEDNQTDCVVNGLVGAVGCQPTLAAIEAGKYVGLANKETLVMAGDIINRALKENPGSRLTPIDSEHSAVFQCLGGRPPEEVEKLLLTASGGPFRTLPRSEFSAITKQRALKHPTWSMGPKITIDSATMMNKGLEIIEAHFLFQIAFDNIKVIIHPSSIVHSFVQFRDGSLMAQMGSPDMQLPILYALTWPERWQLNVKRLTVKDYAELRFFPPDLNKFPCIPLAYRAGKAGGTAPAVVNAANESAVALFLKDHIHFTQIPETIEYVLNQAEIVAHPGIQDVLKADKWARRQAGELHHIKEADYAGF